MSNVPNAKVISASGLGAVISQLIIDVVEGRLLVDLSLAEQAAIVFACTFIAGYVMPELNQHDNRVKNNTSRE